MSNTIEVGIAKFELDTLDIKRNKRVDDPEKPGKKKTIEEADAIITPRLKSASDVKDLFVAAINAAEESQAGNGLALGLAILMPRLEAFNEAGGEFATATDKERAVLQLVQPERPRSAGLNKEDINKELSEIATELAVIGPYASDNDGWKKLVDSLGRPMFTGQDQFLLRLSELYNSINRLNQIKQAKEQKAAEAKAKREAKAKQAAAAAAATAVAAAAS